MTPQGALVFFILVCCALACMVVAASRVIVEQRRKLESKPKAEPGVPFSPGWTATERDALKGYLATPEGKKLIARLRATEYVSAVANAKDQFHTQHSAGQTCGYSNCIRHILSLAACEVAAKDSPASGEAQAADPSLEELTRLSP